MNSVKQKTSMHKRLLLFMNLDIIDQIVILLKFFLPVLIIGGGIQYLFHYDENILGVIFGIFVVVVVFLSLPSDNIEICSNKMRYTRFLTMCANLMIGIFYLGIMVFVSANLLNLIEQYININENALFVFRCVWVLIWVMLFIWLIIFKYNSRLFFKLQYGEIKRIHNLNVEKAEFLQIAQQKKNFEFRLADIKRRRIKIGDILIFQNIDNQEEFINTEVKDLQFANNFNELRQQMPSNAELKENLHLLNEQYPAKKQKKRKVIAIQFEIMD